jgi:hypothetical protein
MHNSLDVIAGILCNRAPAVWLCNGRQNVKLALEAKKDSNLHAAARAAT